jgi:hypothetical protein
MPDGRVSRPVLLPSLPGSRGPGSRIVRVCAAILTVLAMLVLSSAPATADPSASDPSASDPSSTDSGTSATGATADAGSGTDEGVASNFLRLSVTSMSPSLVTSSGSNVVTVTGRLENIGDRMLRNLSVRLERGDAVADAAGLRSSLAVTPVPVSAATPFRPISMELQPGSSISFTVSASLSGENGLDIQRTGVFPLNVNVNGLPDYGNRAKLAQSRTLLPVLSLPPDRARAQQYVDPSEGEGETADTDLGADGSVSADLSSPSRLTMLWPLSAPPQLTPGVLGGSTQPVRLVGDDLSRSLSPGGRLDTLLAAARSVTGDDGSDDADGDSDTSLPPGSEPATSGSGASQPPESSAPSSGQPSSGQPSSGQPAAPAGRQPSKLQQSMCLAIDPDLLVTVRAMSLGYEVSSDPMDPTSPATPGTGQSAAADWLAELRDVSSRMCTVALPFAQADLTSLSRIANSGLTDAALTTPSDVVDAILGVRSVRGLTIPALGAIDATGASVLSSAGIGKAVTSTTGVDPTRSTPTGVYRVGDLSLQTSDPSVTAALAAAGNTPATTPLTPPAQRVSFDDESAAARRQAALSALAYPSIASPGRGQGARPPLPVAGRSSFVVPPTYWAPSTDDANALFTTATVLLESGAASPGPLSDVVDGLDRTTADARFVPPPGVDSLASLGLAVDDRTAATIRDHADLSFQLQASLMSSADVAASPERYMAPLREDLLRAVRSPDREAPAVRAQMRTQRDGRIAAVETTLARMRNSVTILDPGGRYTLASERSPLLLVVRNDLSLPIRVRIDVSAPPELDVGDLGVIEIPANGTRQIQLPTRAENSEAITVTIGMSTSSGISLGSPISLSVHANAYGKPLFYVTIIAGITLVLLTARRLWHRFRGQPDPADEDRPDPDEHDRLLAGSTYQQRRRTLHQEHRALEDPVDEDAPDPDRSETGRPDAGRAGPERADQTPTPGTTDRERP